MGLRRRRQQRRVRAVCLLILGAPLFWYGVWHGGISLETRLQRANEVSTWRATVGGSRSISMIELPGTPLWVGSPQGRSDEQLRREQVDAFSMSQYEIRVRDFVVYLNRAEVAYDSSEQIMRDAAGRYRAARGFADHPVAYVELRDAEGYCQWLSVVLERKVRLPTEVEWECAARGGGNAMPYATGWRARQQPAGRGRVEGPYPVQRGDVNDYGVVGLSGNVSEWCIPPLDAEGSQGVARGSSWAERDASMQQVYRRLLFDPAYRDRDLGFRIVITP